MNMAKGFNLPAPIIETHGGFAVVRDDLLPGGTKMRYMLPILSTVKEPEIVYATPAVGYAQLALAHVCKILGKQAVLFVAKRSKPHPRTLMAKAAGAIVYQVPHGYLNVVQSRARQYAADKGAYLVPFGVDIPEALDYFAAAAKLLNISPAEVWTCSGSGALTRGLQIAWPGADFHTIRVGAEPKVGKAKLYTAPEKFDRPARYLPPYPSCAEYDAKIWQYAVEKASPGALIWNVGA
jgi:hypothetical protein